MQKIIRAIVALLLFPVLLVLPRKRLLKTLFAGVYYLLITPWAAIRRLTGRRRGWLSNAPRMGWIDVDVRSDDRTVYEGQA